MRWLPWLLSGLVACGQTPLDSAPPEPLAPRPIPVERSCEQLASQNQGASWREIGVLPASSGAFVVADPSVLGGPFAAPLRPRFEGPLSLRALVVREGPREVLLCLQARAGTAARGERRLLGHVGVDTGMLLLGDEEQLTKRLAPAAALVVPCAEAPAEELEKLQKHLGTAGERLVAALPTLVCLERAAIPEDQARIGGALRQIRSEGRFTLEPRGPAWPILGAIGSRPWAFFPEERAPVGVIVGVDGPDGAYPVISERDGDRLVLLEIPLR